MAQFPWDAKSRRHLNSNNQVKLLDQVILNIMSNFVPYQPRWLNLFRKQNKIYRKYKQSDDKDEDKVVLGSLAKRML